LLEELDEEDELCASAGVMQLRLNEAPRRTAAEAREPEKYRKERRKENTIRFSTISGGLRKRKAQVSGPANP
jgi:hypothetical protein